jgi:tRNA 2-thiouridine synthesizing protein A
VTARAPGTGPDGPRLEPAAVWDAGDLGCGELVLELKHRLEAIPPGQILALTARDPGAREDLPAWCRMTGHALVAHEHPTYCIRRKER